MQKKSKIKKTDNVILIYTNKSQNNVKLKKNRLLVPFFGEKQHLYRTVSFGNERNICFIGFCTF